MGDGPTFSALEHSLISPKGMAIQAGTMQLICLGVEWGARTPRALFGAPRAEPPRRGE